MNPPRPLARTLLGWLAPLRPPSLGAPILDRVFAILSLMALSTIWLFRYPAGVDLPQHANILRILADYADPTTGYAAFYERQFVTPYFVTYLVALPFAKLFGPLVAVKIVLSIAAVATPWTMIRWLQSQGGEPWWGLFGFPLTFGFGYHWGFLSFVFVIPVALIYLTSVNALVLSPTQRRAAISALWALFLYFTHGIAFAVAMLTVAGLAVVRLVQRPSPRSLLLIGAHVVPAGVVTLAWQIGPHVPGLSWIAQWPPGNDRFVALLSGELTCWPTYATIAIGVGILLVMLVASRPGLAADPARIVPLLVAVLSFVLLPETVAATWLVGMRMLVFVHLFAAAAFDPGVVGRRLAGMRIVTTLLVAGWLAAHGVRLKVFNDEMKGLTALIDAIPAHADVRGLVNETDSGSRAFGPVLGQTPAWVTASNAGFFEYDSGRYFQLPIQRPHDRPWIASSGYRWFVARGPGDILKQVTELAGPVRVVRHADSWWLFESQRSPAATGGLEVVRHIQEKGDLQVDRSLEGRALLVNGHPYGTGFATHALSRIQVRVLRPGTTLRGLVAVDDTAREPTEVVFKIRGTDGQSLFESPPVTNRGAPVPFTVPLGGRRDLVLSAEVTPRCPNNHYAHADWLSLAVD